MDKAVRDAAVKLIAKKATAAQPVQKTIGSLVRDALLGSGDAHTRDALMTLGGLGVGAAGLGSLLGSGLGVGAAKLTSPVPVDMNSIRATELNDVYRQGIQDVRDRIERRLVNG